ncbi:hypothetical protein LTS07_004210 [Exophiala sideris]|uniref:Clr5 domain-containing protein n=1 Tax=Exophiala sideris TaxID=1016849 RepID=A0ABR0JEG4_9EURO|nr:hypothetical protein LTS07_004210 [Exophiala sideris]KAK5062324.1 hypothetical protein LTR69_004682 [Exophiala sideris]
MSRTRQSKLSGLKIIKQDGRTSGYNGRLTEEELDRIKPLLQHLHQTDATRAQMIAQIKSRCGLAITLPQLDGMRTKLGLTAQISRPQAASLKPEPTLDPWQEQSPILRPTHPTRVEPDLSQILSGLEDDEILADYNSEPVSQATVPIHQDATAMQSERAAPLDLPDQTSLGATSASPTSFHERLPSYDMSSSWILTLSDTSKAQEGDDQFIARRFHAAFILHALGAFDQAFDMFSLIFNDLHALSSDASAPDPRLKLSAVGCTWSARTPLRLEVTKILVNEVYRIFTAHYGEKKAVFAVRWTWPDLEEIHRQLSGPNGLPSRMISESTETAAHWLAISCLLSYPERNRPTLLSRLCTTIRSTILANLAELYNFMSENRRSIDHSLEVYCHSQPLHCEIITQALACLYLEHKTRQVAILRTQVGWDQLCPECFSLSLDIAGLVPVTLPRVLAMAIERLDLPVQNIVFVINMSERDKFLSLLCAAAKMVPTMITSSSSDFYSSMVDLFLDQTMPDNVLASGTAEPLREKQSIGDRTVLVAGLLSGLVSGEGSPSMRLDARNENSRANSAQNDVTTEVREVPVLFERSESSTTSSDWRLFRATSIIARESRRNLASMEYSFGMTSSQARSSHGDDMFGVFTGLPSDPSIPHGDRTDYSYLLQSIGECTSRDMSDVLMSG